MINAVNFATITFKNSMISIVVSLNRVKRTRLPGFRQAGLNQMAYFSLKHFIKSAFTKIFFCFY